MLKNQITTTIKIQAIIDEAQRELQAFGNSLKATWKQGEPPKKFSKEFESLKQHLVSLQEIAKKGTVDTSDISRAESDYRALKKGIHDLTVEFKLLSTEQKKALIDPQEQAAIKARTEAVKKYTEAIEKNEEALKKMRSLEARKAELTSTQEQLTTDKNKLATRKKELSGGPQLSETARDYKNNIDQATKLRGQIEKAQDNIQNLKLKGKKEEGADISRIREELAKLEQQLGEIDVVTGKLDFEEAWARHRDEVEKVEASLKDTETELKNTDSELEKVNKSLSNLETLDIDKEFQNLKDTLKNLGVEGADSAKDIDELRAMLQQLESDALKKVEKSLKKEVTSLEKLGIAADSTKKELDDATESIKAQNEAIAQQEAFETRIKQFLGIAGAAQVSQLIPMKNVLIWEMHFKQDLAHSFIIYHHHQQYYYTSNSRCRIQLPGFHVVLPALWGQSHLQ